MISGQALQERMMRDTCEVLPATVNTEAAEPSITYAASGTPTRCGVQISEALKAGVREAQDGSQVTLEDRTILLPLATVVSGRDRLKVTKLFEADLGSPIIYAILGEPRQEPGCLVVNCRRITGGSKN
ncbi:MAG: hypothetical protein GHCLOJNM_03072 [bacterium]|nr:hypothetical protein [bacterium]